MFQFPGCPPHELWIHSWVTGHYPRRVSPFGYPRIKACLRLPVAFRSLPRPSSAIGALASTLCPYSLDLLSQPLVDRVVTQIVRLFLKQPLFLPESPQLLASSPDFTSSASDGFEF